MIGKVISGGSFGGTVGYVMKEQSRVLEARGVEPPGVREMVEDFEDQARLNPRLQQNVGHISLSFSPEDAPKLKPITRQLDPEPILSQELLRLAVWMHDRFFCTIYDALHAILPAGVWHRYAIPFGAAPRPAPSPLPSGLQSRR